MGVSKGIFGEIAQAHLDALAEEQHILDMEERYFSSLMGGKKKSNINQSKSNTMQKKSVVTGVQANGTWEGRYGINYKFEVSFENGDAGEYSSSKFTSVDQVPFKVGQESEYEYVDGQYPKVKQVYKKDFKPSYSTPGNNDDRELMIVRQSSLKVAIDYLNLKGFPESDKNGLDILTSIADHLTKWVMSGEDKQIKTGGSVESVSNPKLENVLSDDLPF